MDQVQQVRERIDIVSLITEYIPLRQAGRNFKATCPFHTEKSASFVVSPERQIWHCFGCQKGGDVYSFLMEYEGLEFPEALRMLAKKAGIELISASADAGITSQKEKIYKLNKLASEFYHFLLTSHAVGGKALKYVHDRGIKDAVIKTFLLGYAPQSGNALVRYLQEKKKYKKEEIIEAGLGFYKNGRLVDFFVNRLMFPLCDHRDNIIGFSGRILEEGPYTSKYVNTRETLVYHKGSTFFGLNVTKQEIKKENTVLIMEGEFDVMSSFQEGVGNVVAVKGTALTENQVQLLARFAKKVILCFDQDKAGKDALKRSIGILEKKGMTTAVVVLDGKDPDEVIQKDSVAFKKAVKHDIGAYDFLFDDLIATYGVKTAEAKKRITDELLPFISAIENEIVKEHYLRKLSQELDVSYESIMRQLEKTIKKEPTLQQKVVSSLQKPRELVLEEYLLALIVQHKDPMPVLSEISSAITTYVPQEQAVQKILHKIVQYSQTHVFESQQFGSTLPKELSAVYDMSFLFPLPKLEDEKRYREELLKVMRDLSGVYVRTKMKYIQEQMKIKTKEKDEVGVQALQEEFGKLVNLLHSV